MTRLFCVLLVIAPVRKLSAGGGCTDDIFEKYSDTVSNSVRAAISEQRISDALAMIDQWLSSFDSLDDCSREQYKVLEINGYYYSARLNAAAQRRPEAYDALKHAVDLGFRNYHLITKDKFLSSYVDDPMFTEIFEAISERGDYLSILRNSGGYRHSSQRAISFRYLNNDPALKQLRLKYGLDTIAGSGAETEQMIRLMNWVHTRITYDGNAETPMPRNAESLLTRCKSEGQMLDCRGLAIVLNEIYLAMGYQSRIVACMPKDTLDRESHVIVSVFSRSHQKWLWMDPTNNAYVTDSDGNLLGIAEVRRMLIEGGDVYINSDANINGLHKRTGDEYLYEYMAKNLYWFESPQISGYDSETFDPNRRYDYIRLVPSDEARSTCSSSLYEYGTVLTTDDESQFWQKPM